MINSIPFAAVAMAMLAIILKMPKLHHLRWVAVLVSIGIGQIYAAPILFLLFLAAENDWRLSESTLKNYLPIATLLFIIIILLTIYSGINWRKLSEVGQLALYIMIYTLLINYLTTANRITQFLEYCSISSILITSISFLAIFFNLKEIPDVFIDRGPNEGADFIALIGFVPSIYMLITRKKPVYIFILIANAYIIYLATSRGNLLICGLVCASALFFFMRNILIRSLIFVGCLYFLVTNIPQLQILVDEQLNFSTKERILLAEAGWEMAQERFWTGWGWGSTNLLAEQAPTVIAYPHFHNTYIQLLVELGFLGWLLIVFFVYFVVSRSYIAFTKIQSGPVSTLIVSCSLGLIVAGFFDAMLFGADRALQVAILIALINQSVKVGLVDRVG